MTCKDCIHYERCNSITISENGVGKTVDSFSSPNLCCWYKDKSRYIELPCKVGDTVYQIDLDTVVECEVRQFGVCDWGLFYFLEFPGFGIYETAKGDKVFLTREEAEKIIAKR